MKDALQVSVLVLGLLGIGLILNGTYKLFTQFTGLREIKPFPEPDQKRLEKDDLYRDLLVKINDAIKHSNKLNEDQHNLNHRWIKQIVLGSCFEAAAVIVSFIGSKI